MNDQCIEKHEGSLEAAWHATWEKTWRSLQDSTELQKTEEQGQCSGLRKHEEPFSMQFAGEAVLCQVKDGDVR